MTKSVKWMTNIHSPQIKRPCECQCCFGCGTNNICNIFGPNFCKECEEWRCNKCYNGEKTLCRFCLREY